MVDNFLRDGGCGPHEHETTTTPGSNGKQPGPLPPCGGTPIGMPLDENTKFNCGIGVIILGGSMRQKGSRNALVKIDNDLIDDLARVAWRHGKQYAHRGEYDPRSLDSVLQWVNA
jgi:hypothetical protein